VGFLI